MPVDDSQNVTILHVSDTQFGRYHRFGDGVDSLAFQLVRDLRKIQEEGVPPADLVVLSGDIAEQGRKAEYSDARAFIDALMEHTGLDADRVVVVPGNHDVSWPLSEAHFAECRAEEAEPKAGTPLAVLQGDLYHVRHIDWSPDGKVLVGYGGGMLYGWKLTASSIMRPWLLRGLPMFMKWRLAQETEPASRQDIDANQLPVQSAGFSVRHGVIAVGTADGAISLGRLEVGGGTGKWTFG